MRSATKRKPIVLDYSRCTELDDLVAGSEKEFESAVALAAAAECSVSTIYRYRNKPVYRPQFPVMQRIAWARGMRYQLVSAKHITPLRMDRFKR